MTDGPTRCDLRRAALWLAAAGALAGAPPCAAAGAADEPDLPPAARVAEALRAYPSVLAAQAGLRAQGAQSAALRAGPYEFNVRVDADQRREPALGNRYHEWGAIVERPVRLPEKARIDREVGDVTLVQGRAAVGDAMHEASRTLLKLWFGWTRAAAQLATWTRQVAALDAQRDIVARRVRLGDAPRQEMLQADAAVAQADFARLQAQARTASASAELSRTFPEIPVPDRPEVRDPRLVGEDAKAWRDAYLQHSHELGVFRAESSRRSLLAARARAETLPDPTLGVRYSTERDNADRIVGVFVSIPLAGDLRAARAEEAGAQSEAASQREAAVRRRLEAEVASLYAGAVAAYDSALRAIQAAKGMSESAELTTKAYALGEVNLSEVLLARRLAIEADLAGTLAKLDAAEQRYRLLLDTHRLWPLDSDD